MNTLLIALALLAPRPGDLERVCGTTCGTVPTCEVTEKWNNPVAIPWSLNNTGNLVPGMCPSNNSIGTNSVTFAFGAWGGVHYTGNACDPAPRAGHSHVAGCTPTLAACSFAAGPSVGAPNTVTFKDGAAYWSTRGGDFAIANTSVTFSAGIQGSSTHLNTTTQNPIPDPSPAWGWVEWQSVTQGTLGGMPESEDATQLVYASTSTPKQGFVDILGFLTHESGHVLGLGHSVVDSMADKDGSRFPTMFPVAQGQPFAALRLTGCPPSSSTTAIDGVIYGLSARDLEVDDVAAISRGYPVTGTTTANTARITGKVANAYHGRGYSVVAISTTCPDKIRAGAISYGTSTGIPPNTITDTQYDLGALPPGAYYLYSESVDRPPENGFPPAGPGANLFGFYFPSPLDLPNYVVTEFGFGGCNSAPFTAYELWNTGETFGEARQLASPITLTAGQHLAQSDIVHGFVSGPQVRVGIVDLDNPSATPPSSFRGVQVDLHDDLPTPRYSKLRILATGTPGKTVQILMTPILENGLANGQLRQVKDLSGKILPIPNPMGGTFDASGEFQVDVTLDEADLYRNLHIQARVKNTPSGPTVELSNVVNAWVYGR